MTFMDGFWFQLGRGLAEFLVAMGFLTVFTIMCVVAMLFAGWKEDRRK